MIYNGDNHIVGEACNNSATIWEESSHMMTWMCDCTIGGGHMAILYYYDVEKI